jgi:formylglycine-generating enzyme required for sulfatase activity
LTRTQPDLTVLTPEEARANAAKPGSEFKECGHGCPVMTVVPAGNLLMGSSERESDQRPTERPQHGVTIGYPVAVSKFEVTFAEWDTCVAASACSRAADAWGRGDMPVVNVSWDDARQYVGWLSHVTGKPYRLLTEAEWEYAARAGSGTRVSWGDDPGANNANCVDCGSKWTLETAPVGSFKPNAWGLYDFSGNVWEWVEDSWHGTYRRAGRRIGMDRRRAGLSGDTRWLLA